MQPSFKATRESESPLRIAIYVPSQTKEGKKRHHGITRDDLLKVTLNFLIFEFGGATAPKSEGYFVNPKTDRRQAEEVTVIYSNTSPALLKKHLLTIEELANDLAVRLNQESVSFEIGSSMYFASPTQRYRDLNQWLLPKLISSPLKLKRGWSKYVDIAPFWPNVKDWPSKLAYDASLAAAF